MVRFAVLVVVSITLSILSSPIHIRNLSCTALFGLRYTSNLVYTAVSPRGIFFFFNNLVVSVSINLSTSAAIAGFRTDFVVGSCIRCLYSNYFPVFGPVIAFTLISNTLIPCINDFMSTSPVLSSIIPLRRNGGMFSFVRGSSIWVLFFTSTTDRSEERRW